MENCETAMVDSPHGLVIEAVIQGSVAEELEMEPGDRLLMINGNTVRDIIDYNYYSADDELLFLVQKTDGDLWEIEFDNPFEPIGLSFPPPRPASCDNNCIFCFVHQLPRGMRRPLYVKDEDYRLSFLYGNYVTLSNIKDEEIERIIEQRLSPLYISVHTTDILLREKLLGRTGGAPLKETMERFAAAGIVMHTQFVLCPGINDGEELQKSIDDLRALHPKVASIAIVPLGLTRHRKGLPELSPVTAAYAAEFIAGFPELKKRVEAQAGEELIYIADEFYIKAGAEFPPLDEYGDLPQIENGVGMIPLFEFEKAEVLERAAALDLPDVTVVTGVSPSRYVQMFAAELATVTGSKISVAPILNRFFGEEVTVTGLLTGQDIVEQLKGRGIKHLFLPDVLLKEGEGLLLDDMTPEGIGAALDCSVTAFDATPAGFYEALIELAAGGDRLI